MQKTTFFLGANTPNGFHSLYDGFVHPEDGDFLWVLKGTPGSGKSSFMKHIGATAENAGLDVEYIYCSGDPDSLDGVYIPQKHIAYVDGTSPHVIEPPLPGAGGAYLDLTQYIDHAALSAQRDALAALTRRYKAKYSDAYSLLSSLPGTEPEHLDGLLTAADISAVRRRAKSAVRRNIPVKVGAVGTETRRFLGAFTFKGRIVLTDTVRSLCRRIYALDDQLGLNTVFLREIAAGALQHGENVICCMDPLDPEKPEAVLLPGLSLAYVSAGISHGLACRRIRLDDIPDKQRIQAFRGRIRALAHIRSAVLAQAEQSLAEAKALHDELEALYNPHVDFDRVFDTAQKHMDALLQGFEVSR